VRTRWCLSLDFSHKGFYKKDIYYIDSVSPKLSQEVKGVFHNISRMKTFIFPTGFLKDYIRVHSYFSVMAFGGVWYQSYVGSTVQRRMLKNIVTLVITLWNI
jgi:hypothetical protein